MARRRATTEPKPGADLWPNGVLDDEPQAPPEPEPEPEPPPAEADQEQAEQERTPTPHQVDRKRRAMSVTFPGAAWVQAVRDQARAWHVRPSDFLVWCVAYALRAIRDGVATRPRGDVDEHRHRAGEGLELPWEP